MADGYQLETSADRLLLEDGSGILLLETVDITAIVPSTPSATARTLAPTASSAVVVDAPTPQALARTLTPDARIDYVIAPAPGTAIARTLAPLILSDQLHLVPTPSATARTLAPTAQSGVLVTSPTPQAIAQTLAPLAYIAGEPITVVVPKATATARAWAPEAVITETPPVVQRRKRRRGQNILVEVPTARAWARAWAPTVTAERKPDVLIQAPVARAWARAWPPIAKIALTVRAPVIRILAGPVVPAIVALPVVIPHEVELYLPVTAADLAIDNAEERFRRIAAKFKKRVPMTRRRFLRLSGAARSRAFTVAHVTQMDVLRDLLNATAKAMAAGEPLAQFQDSVQRVMRRRGWAGTTPWHVELVLRNNVQFMYGWSRLEEANNLADIYEFAEYDATRDSRTRPHHAALHGKIFRVGSAAYRNYYPPWEHGCRCSMNPVAADELGRRKPERENYSVGVDPGDDFEGPGYGFQFRPDLARYTPKQRAQVRQALKRRPKLRG